MSKMWNRWVSFRHTVRELEKLTTRDLADIGINAADIHEIARQDVMIRFP